MLLNKLKNVVPGSVFQWIVENEPDKVEKWDGWNYHVYGPTLLDDDMSIHIELHNENSFRQDIVISPYRKLNLSQRR